MNVHPSHASYETDKLSSIRELHALKLLLEFEISNMQLLLNTSLTQKQDQQQQDKLMLKDQEKNLKEMKLKEELEKKVREEQAKFGELNQSTLLNSKQLDRFTNEIMKGITSSNEGKKLLFKASRDGFAARTFHSKCDNKGPTIVIVKSTSGAIFGGYSSISWGSKAQYVVDSSAFLFSLQNQERFVKYTQENSYYYNNGKKMLSRFDLDSYGPTFGGGHDLHISDNANLTSNSCSQLCYSYCDSNISQVSDLSNRYLDGAMFFQVADYEVYSW